MAYKLVIFDFDGTLADSFPWFLGVFNEVADRFGTKRLEPGEVDRVRRLGSRRILGHFGVPRWKLPAIAAHMRRLAARDAAAIALVPGAEAALQRLAERGVRLAVVSSNTEANVRRVLGPRTAGLIAHYACGASLFGKPARLGMVVRASRLPKSEILSVGDEMRDGEAARQAGLAFGAVAWGFAAPEALAELRPAHVFESFDEIVALVAPEPAGTAPAA